MQYSNVFRCHHWNDSYGRCILLEDHEPVNNGAGVFYKHMYEPNGSYGNLDVLEAVHETPKL